MAKFKYTSRTKQGELQTGFVEAANRETATGILVGHELFLLSIETVEKPAWYAPFLDLFQRVRQTDLMIFTRQFATLLEAKISLGDSLKNVYRQTRNLALKEVVSELSSDIDSGLSLSQAMDRHRNVFSDFYVSMVRSAEVTGRLEEVIGFMADYLEKESGLISKVRNALIYPALIIGLFIVVVGIMVGLVFPQLEPIFLEANVSLPFYTQILLSSGTFVAEWWPAIIIILVLFSIVFLDYAKSPEGKIVIDEVLLRLPVIGDLYKKMYVARFAESSSVLVRGAIPIAQALEISGHTIGSIVYRDILHEVAESVRGGQLMSQSLAQYENYFPPLVSQMVSVGESTGKLETLLSRVSDFYTKEVDNLVSNLVELIQPTLMIGIGVLVAILFASVLLPIYSLVQTF